MGKNESHKCTADMFVGALRNSNGGMLSSGVAQKVWCSGQTVKRWLDKLVKDGIIKSHIIANCKQLIYALT